MSWNGHITGPLVFLMQCQICNTLLSCLRSDPVTSKDQYGMTSVIYCCCKIKHLKIYTHEKASIECCSSILILKDLEWSKFRGLHFAANVEYT